MLDPHGSKKLRGILAIALEGTKGGHNMVKGLHVHMIQDLSRKRLFQRRSLKLFIELFPKSLSLAMDSSLSLLSLMMELWGQYDNSPKKESGPFVAMLNGVLGDFLYESKSPLATEMDFVLPDPPPFMEPKREGLGGSDGDHLLILVHGSCLDESCFETKNGNFGQKLAKDLGVIPVYLRYNSGRHIYENGELLSQVLTKLIADWPGQVKGLSFLAHSMGGLVVRSACYFAESSQDLWRTKVSTIVFLGTPHGGAPLERFGHELYKQMNSYRYSSVFARLLRIRSAGVTDLRYGSILYRGGRLKNRFGETFVRSTMVPLPEGVDCYAVAGTLSLANEQALMGDGIVPLTSALGEGPRPEMTLTFAEDRKVTVSSTNHLGLLASPVVYSKLLNWFSK